MQSQPPRTGALTLGAMGVVYGDIGTSPLYAFKECFNEAHGLQPTTEVPLVLNVRAEHREVRRVNASKSRRHRRSRLEQRHRAPPPIHAPSVARQLGAETEFDGSGGGVDDYRGTLEDVLGWGEHLERPAMRVRHPQKIIRAPDGVLDTRNKRK